MVRSLADIVGVTLEETTHDRQPSESAPGCSVVVICAGFLRALLFEIEREEVKNTW
jgi:hypothetical protein